MRRALLTAVVGFALLFGVSVRGEDFVLDRFGDYLELLRVQLGIPGLAAAIVDSNDIVWERAFGRQDLEAAVATRTDTPFHVDGVTQIFTAAMALRCVEEGHLSLDDRVSQFKTGSADGNATIGQLLSHTTETPSGLVFSYHPERLEPLLAIVRACAVGSFRKTLTNLLDVLSMRESVPGPDIATLVPPAEGIPAPEAAEQYKRILGRLAVPYAVDSRGRASRSQYDATTLTPATGVISTVRDIAHFDLALKKGLILRPDTLALAWQPPVGANKQRLPHGYGWFVQSYNGAPVIWQFGDGDNSSSSLVVTLPARGLTLILVANSSGLSRPFALASGDLTASPFGRLFLGVFVR
jgi:CubicO group peptidase (beta-lactamase class C family)